MNNAINISPYLRTSRSFPDEIKQLTVEVNKSYVDIANAVNTRIIGIFPSNTPAITGKSWYITQNQKQQSLTQAYTFTTTANIPHGINFNNVTYMAPGHGEYTDGTNWYGIIAGTSVAIAGQISFYLTPTNIVFLTGAGAPSIVKGIIILEYISNA